MVDVLYSNIMGFLSISLLCFCTYITLKIDTDSHKPYTDPSYELCMDSAVDTVMLDYLIHSECSICDEEEKRLIASVVLNRMDATGDAMYTVISRKGQFLGFGSDQFTHSPTTYSIASEVMQGKGREYNMFFFFARDSPNKRFLNSVDYLICKELKHHSYATRER